MANDIKYFVCIKEIEDKQDKQDNPFLDLVFNKNRGRYRDEYNLYVNDKLYEYIGNHTYYNYDDFCGASRYSFKKGRIYKSLYNGQYIIDDNNIAHNIAELVQYFKPFELEIEPQAEKIIQNKLEHGDHIKITPYNYNFKAKQTTYLITCAVNFNSALAMQTYQTMNYSQVDGIIYCYKALREKMNRVGRLKMMLEGRYYDRLYRFSRNSFVKEY